MVWLVIIACIIIVGIIWYCKAVKNIDIHNIEKEECNDRKYKHVELSELLILMDSLELVAQIRNPYNHNDVLIMIELSNMKDYLSSNVDFDTAYGISNIRFLMEGCSEGVAAHIVPFIDKHIQ